jgi:amino acid transporter
MKSRGTDSLTAFSYAMPLITYCYLGVKIVIITAFEARDNKSLRRPSQIIAYFIMLLYILAAIGGLLNISRRDNRLPKIGIGPSNDAATADKTTPQSSSMVVIALWDAGFESLAGFINGCVIFSLISVSNTAMYVASRTAYGIGFKIRAENIAAKALRSLAIVTKNGVPAAALVLSAISFAWMPFLEYTKGYATQSVSIGGTERTLHY